MLKEFFKNISIYGILPVVGKFMGFFLIPVYARVFSTVEFGIVELITTLVSFLVFACNLEIYTSVGRYFYEKESIKHKGVLISTGLFLTIITSLFVVLLSFLFEDTVLKQYIGSASYLKEYRFGIVWLFVNAISTYLSIIPRYEKRPKLYVIVNSTSLFFRFCSTIIFVIFLKVGIIGVIYGHIVGDTTSILLNGLASKRYLQLNFSGKDAISIIKYAFPLVPGLLTVGLWNPLSRNLITTFFSVSVLGLYAFALRFASITSIFNGALRNTWQPILFENMKDKSFVTKIREIAGVSTIITVGIGVFITLLSPNLCFWIGTEKYMDSAILIGFLSLSGTFNVLSQIRGYAPLVNNKTYVHSLINIFSLLMGVAAFYFINDTWGLLGLGIIMVLYNFLNYILLAEYTRIKEKVMLYNLWELLLFFFQLISIVLIIVNAHLFVRVVTLLLYLSINIVILKKINWLTRLTKITKQQ
jgi:O-antigen/teichoic acid export membrane protein